MSRYPCGSYCPQPDTPVLAATSARQGGYLSTGTILLPPMARLPGSNGSVSEVLGAGSASHSRAGRPAGASGILEGYLDMYEKGRKHLSMIRDRAAGLPPELSSYPGRRPTGCAQNHSVRESGTAECSSRRREARCSGGTSDRGDAQGRRQPGQQVSGNPHPQPPLGAPGSLTAVSETARKTFDSWRKKCT